MKTEPNSAANGYGFTTANGDSHVNEAGLTKREHMAIEFTKAIVTSLKNADAMAEFAIENICKNGLKITDELIKQLNEK